MCYAGGLIDSEMAAVPTRAVILFGSNLKSLAVMSITRPALSALTGACIWVHAHKEITAANTMTVENFPVFINPPFTEKIGTYPDMSTVGRRECGVVI